MFSPPEARILRYVCCGGGLAIMTAVPWIACPSCSTTQPVPPELFRELASYQPFGLVLGLHAPSTVDASAMALSASTITLLGWVVGGLTSLVGAVLAIHAGWNVHRWGRIFRTLEATLGSRRSRSRGSMIAWLNRYCSGALSIDDLVWGPFGVAFTATLGGYPALLILDAVQSGEQHQSKVVLLIAAQFPHPTTLPRGPLLDAVERLGLSVTCSEDGG